MRQPRHASVPREEGQASGGCCPWVGGLLVTVTRRNSFDRGPTRFLGRTRSDIEGTSVTTRPGSTGDRPVVCYRRAMLRPADGGHHARVRRERADAAERSR
jgi:hypothetical protein